MVKTPKVTVLGKKTKGPFMFLRYLTKDRMSAELVHPYQLDKIKVGGKQYFNAKIFRESTSNIALAKVNRDDFTLTLEEQANLISYSQK